MIKDILLIIDNAVRAEPIIHAALAMAERESADLTIEILTAGPLFIPALAPMTAMYLPESELARDEAARIQAVADTVARSFCVARVLGLHDDMFGLARRAGKAGPIADIIIMGDAAMWETEWLRKHAAETVIMAGGTPLVIGNAKARLAAARHAAIGWKDSAEARRAMHDLIPLVEPGGQISVVTVAQDQAEADAMADSVGEVVRHFTRHGFDAQAHQLLAGVESDASALEAFALGHDVELLALGAFGHWRLRDVILGGVTHAMIDQPRLPLLLSR
ncbi:universal stress protein [Sphingomonas sp. AR_OL41]|uniref:universal stress protein n=1 Tax=Sphingomonas sp. AR_OL41 TaxID=3042729 RepID=UPI0024803F4D|nr:universal stress protein [Sphingomonas sp. AR_OL41]MDH7974848.1 universal stress protein [Sphingomonas sp. AR_OL41]